MSEDDLKQAYWRSNSQLTLVMIVIVALAALLLPLVAPLFEGHRFLRFPLGYFFVSQLSLIVLAILLSLIYSGQKRSERINNMTIQF